jgi:hypothetical protein
MVVSSHVLAALSLKYEYLSVRASERLLNLLPPLERIFGMLLLLPQTFPSYINPEFANLPSNILTALMIGSYGQLSPSLALEPFGAGW